MRERMCDLKAILLVIGICFGVLQTQAQSPKLAQNYFNNGEYQKAATIYKSLYQKQNRNPFYFERYIASLLELASYDEALNMLHQEIKRSKNNALHVYVGQIYEKQGLSDKAEKSYQKAINQLDANPNQIQRLAMAFRSKNKLGLAMQTYEKGRTLLKDPKLYSFQLADLYRREGQTAKMIKAYLYSLQVSSNRKTAIQSYFQKYLSEEEFDQLQVILYDFIDQYPDQTVYPELLEWYFISKKDYKNAFRQAKALDIKNNEQGVRIYDLAKIAQNQKVYDQAIKGYQYLIENKNPKSRIVIDAQGQLFKCQLTKITNNPNFSQSELKQLEVDYEQFLKTSQVNRAEIAGLIRQYASFQAKYIHNITKAIHLLNTLIKMPGVNKYIRAQAKLDLGDYYLIQDEIWEASLLYSQVDKEFQEEHLGHEARFRNAKLSYYHGDFEWAQTQFDVLKSSTSKLIANDALELSVFIQDNLGLDTTDVPMRMYALAELLSFQNKYDEAFAKLGELIDTYNDHGLLDDIYYLEAKLYAKQQDYNQAIKKYLIIIDKYSDDIRADNALFELAQIYDNVKNQPDRAQPYYERLFMDYSDSIFAVNARKRFREIRGDILTREDKFMRGAEEEKQ